MSVEKDQQHGQGCPKCGAQQPRTQAECWLCGAELSEDSLALGTADPLQTAPERFSFSLSTLLLLITLASVCFGLIAVEAGLGVPICVLLVPVLVRTAMVVRRREAAGLSVSRVEKISLMASSFGVASVLAVVVSAAAFSGFCGVCLLLVSADGQYGGAGTLVWGLGMCVIAAIAVGASIGVLKWIRQRYRRDIQG